MCGTVTKVGTGMVDILHNMDSLLGNDIENGVDGYDMDLNDSDNDVDLVDEDSDRENTDEDIESEVDDEYDIADYI
jgi:hypothetical protein